MSIQFFFALFVVRFAQSYTLKYLFVHFLLTVVSSSVASNSAIDCSKTLTNQPRRQPQPTGGEPANRGGAQVSSPHGDEVWVKILKFYSWCIFTNF